MRDDRLPLGTLCSYLNLDYDSPMQRYEEIPVTVVGTWGFTKAAGPARLTETRERRFGQDPRTDEAAAGYLLLRSDRPGFIYAMLGDVSLGELTPLF